MQDVLAGLKVYMSMGKAVALLRRLDPEWSSRVEAAPNTTAKAAGSFNPLVRSHSLTGEKGSIVMQAMHQV